MWAGLPHRLLSGQEIARMNEEDGGERGGGLQIFMIMSQQAAFRPRLSRLPGNYGVAQQDDTREI